MDILIIEVRWLLFRLFHSLHLFSLSEWAVPSIAPNRSLYDGEWEYLFPGDYDENN